MKRKILIACLTFWLAACTTQPTPTATFTTAPSNTPTETPIPSPTFTPTPSLTPTLTLTPTHTPTPQPTPTPKGFYSSNQGFTLIYPPGWKFVEESAGEVVFENSWGDINLFVNSYEDESNPTFNEVAADVKSSFTDLAGLKLSPLEDIELGDGTVAPRALITGTNSYQV